MDSFAPGVQTAVNRVCYGCIATILDVSDGPSSSGTPAQLPQNFGAAQFRDYAQERDVTSPIASQLPAPRPDVVARAVGDEMILLDLESGIYYTLNPVGALVWKGLEARSSFDDLLAAILADFEIDQETAASDIQSYVDDLTAQGLLATA